MTKSALLIIDVQNDYFPSFEGAKMALPHMDAASENVAKLLAATRAAGNTVVHVRHVMDFPDAPFFEAGTDGANIHPSVAPEGNEKVVVKDQVNSFLNTDLEEYLRDQGVEDLTICGAMSQMCVDGGTRAASDLGFNVTVAHDACAAASVEHNGVEVPAEMVHASIMAPLTDIYAKVISTDEIVA